MATLPTGLQVRFMVDPSVVMELVWALFIKDDDLEAEFPARAERFVGGPDLPARIRSFWGDGEACFTEVFVVAQRGGVLFEDDPERLWAGLAAGAAEPPGFERLASETPEDQVRFRGRLARLHEEPDLRHRWLSLLRDTWTAVEPAWRDHGRDVAEERAWELRARLPEAGTYADLVPLVGECDFNGRLPQLVAEAGAAGQPAVLVPTWLGRKGFVVSLADCVVWAPPNPSRPAGPSYRRARPGPAPRSATGPAGTRQWAIPPVWPFLRPQPGVPARSESWPASSACPSRRSRTTSASSGMRPSWIRKKGEGGGCRSTLPPSINSCRNPGDRWWEPLSDITSLATAGLEV
jgi:hypothetical protein